MAGANDRETRLGTPDGRGGARVLRVVVIFGVAVFAATRLAAVYTDSVHWDEFGLLATADRTLETGVFHSAGRPGLAVAVLLPFVSDCTDEIEVARLARLLWLGLTLAFLAGLGLLVARAQSDPGRRIGDAALAIGLLALVPAFLDASVQLRTDQIALATGVWGGVALLASRRRPALALVAGLLFGAGYLATQKLVYVAALVALLATWDVVARRDLRPAREALRGGLCAVGGVCALLAFRAAIDASFPPSPASAAAAPGVGATLRHEFDVFSFYRQTIGYSQYRAMLPTLVPHLLLLMGLVAATCAGRVRRVPKLRQRLAVAWAVLALGTAVALFHAGAFFYFWLTLGVFPAVALALALDPLRALVEPLPARARTALVASLVAALALPALFQSAALHADPQAVQRKSLELVHRNFSQRDVGFHAESALFCQADARPFPTYFSQLLYRLFAGEDRDANARALIEEFRARPVKFLVESFRLNQFPHAVRAFWVDHYQPYGASLFVAGRRLAGPAGTRSEFELLVPGDYRWIPAAHPTAVEIDGRPIAPGEVVSLERGPHTAVLSEETPHGLLVLALADPPSPAPLSFYRTY